MISICLTARPSYARVKTVIEQMAQRKRDCEVVCSAGALLRNYGRVRDQITECPVTELYTVVEGSSLETGVLSVATSLDAHARHFARVQPKLVVVIADRREVLGCAMAASYQNIPLLHLLGGEHSGSIDDKVRWAITALADYHAVAHGNAAYQVSGRRYSVGDTSHDGLEPYIRVTGCPSVDLVARGLAGPLVTVEELGGVGAPLDLTQPFDVLLYHPDTTRVNVLADLARSTMAVRPMIIMWPGEDPGSDVIAKHFRVVHESRVLPDVHFVRNLPPERFYRLLSQATRLIGNSSVGVREARSIPNLDIVNIGNRQQGRYAGSYGDGHAGEKIADWIVELT